MPVITVSAEDLKASVRIKAGWYKAKVKECLAEPSKDKSSINYNWYFLVNDNGIEREYKHTINNAVWKSFGPPLVEAVMSEEGKPYKVDRDAGEAWRFDTDDAAGKSVNIKFEDEPYQGNLIAKPKVFLPAYVDIENIPFGLNR